MPQEGTPHTLVCHLNLLLLHTGELLQLDKAKLTAGTRVTLDIMTYTIMRALPREVDPTVYSMLTEDPGQVSFSSVGGLSDQIRELREVIELPLTNPELFRRVGIKPPKVRSIPCRLYARMPCAGRTRRNRRSCVCFYAGCAVVWSTWNRQDTSGTCPRMQLECDILEGSGISHR